MIYDDDSMHQFELASYILSLAKKFTLEQINSITLKDMNEHCYLINDQNLDFK